jgi:predicted transcriptional regulator
MELLAEGDKNINELGQALGLSQPTVTKHVQQLEAAGLVISEYMPGQQGMQKRCRSAFDKILIAFDGADRTPTRVEEVIMPIGLYTHAKPEGTCGLANRNKIIGFLDKPQSFFDPERGTAQILWMSDGFVEYTFPNDLPRSMTIEKIELIMEVCSEAPSFANDWPSDITVWMNGVEVGSWTSPGDFGGRRGLLNPDWWYDHMTQHGLLKIWSIDGKGGFVDGQRASDSVIDSVIKGVHEPIIVRIGVKPDAEHRGGFNLFGSGFGNYAQDLMLRIVYTPRNSSQRPM